MTMSLLIAFFQASVNSHQVPHSRASGHLLTALWTLAPPWRHVVAVQPAGLLLPVIVPAVQVAMQVAVQVAVQTAVQIPVQVAV